MKKVYKAPEIVFESFSLSVSIAATCPQEANAARGTCGYEMGYGMVVFLETVHGCKKENGGTPIVDGANDRLCYHNPSDDYRLFNS